ncbi:MAG: Rnase Y domain-containing protein, partial [Dehalococcoidales bacterium]|nr:Rnase Y domain-containing protein [Dehalococcoidales bacterium]
MDPGIWYIALGAVFVIGVIAGGMIAFFSRRMLINRQIRIAERKATRLLAETRMEAKGIVSEAKQEADKIKLAAEGELRDRRSQLQHQESRVTQK